MHVIQQPVIQPDMGLPVIIIRLDRRTLAKRLWRATASDGTEFGCELQRPLRPGATVMQSESSRYVVEQEPERVLEIGLDMPASAAAGLGWAIGNLHLDLMSEPHRLLTPDEKYIRQFLDRIGVPYRETVEVFRPGQFARTSASATSASLELGTSHTH
jgi:urease accessory protein